uniref:UBX domain-containing protein n=1 Tax=Rhabditophanes sp. KR3021 TaxID=114890 RepID=A0AC35UFL8_9BILA
MPPEAFSPNLVVELEMFDDYRTVLRINENNTNAEVVVAARNRLITAMDTLPLFIPFSESIVNSFGIKMKVEQIYGSGIRNSRIAKIEDRWNFIKMRSVKMQKFLLMIILNVTENASQQFGNLVVFETRVKASYSPRFCVMVTASSSKWGKFAQVNYKFNSYPSALLVDPRTGEQICSLNTSSLSPKDFIEELDHIVKKYPNYEARDSEIINQYGGSLSSNEKVDNEGTNIEEIDDEEINDEVVNVRKRRFSNCRQNETNKECGTSSIIHNRVRFETALPPMKERKLEDMVESMLTTIDMDEYKKYEGPNNGRRIQFCIQLPDGKRENLQLNDSSTMKAVFYFIGGLGYNIREYVIIHSFPKQTIAFQHFYKTLKDMQFHDREFLLVDRK